MRRAILRLHRLVVSRYRPNATNVKPLNNTGLISVPVKGNCVGAAPPGDTEAPTGLVTGGEALVADTEPTPIGGVVVAGADVEGGVGALVAGASGGTAVGEVTVGEVTGAQSSMVCWNPLFATHGGPT